MCHAKNPFARIILWAVICLFYSQTASSEDLNLKILVSKKVYLRNEIVYATVSLRNGSNAEIRTNELSVDLGFLKLILKNRSGKELQSNLPIYAGNPLTLRLDSKQEDSWLFQITPQFGEGSAMPFLSQRFLPDGEYSIEAVFETGTGKSRRSRNPVYQFR